MNIIQRMDAWSDKQRIKWILLLRIALGLVLWFKGLSFISHMQELETLILSGKINADARMLANYVAWSHLFGGAMILIGLFTRIASLIQLPVLIGAVFFINSGSGFMTIDSQLGLSILVLILLVFFLVEGGGPYSIDRYVKKKFL